MTGKKRSKSTKKRLGAILSVNTACGEMQRIDINKYPRTRAAYFDVLTEVRTDSFARGVRSGKDQEAQNIEKQYARADQQARIAAINQITELAKSMSKMAYMLMMTLNGGKPFNGGN